MALFLVVALKESAPVIEAAIAAKIPPDRFYKIEDGTWVIDSNSITAKDVSEHLNLADPTSHITVGFRGYYGRAQPDLWEWIAAKSAKS
jgi:hypothetical protein